MNFFLNVFNECIHKFIEFQLVIYLTFFFNKRREIDPHIPMVFSVVFVLQKKMDHCKTLRFNIWNKKKHELCVCNQQKFQQISKIDEFSSIYFTTPRPYENFGRGIRRSNVFFPGFFGARMKRRAPLALLRSGKKNVAEEGVIIMKYIVKKSFAEFYKQIAWLVIYW